MIKVRILGKLTIKLSLKRHEIFASIVLLMMYYLEKETNLKPDLSLWLLSLVEGDWGCVLPRIRDCHGDGRAGRIDDESRRSGEIAASRLITACHNGVFRGLRHMLIKKEIINFPQP